MSSEVSQFYDRKIYNDALYARYGAPDSLSDYLIKAQISDYEATRSEYEAYSVRKNAERPATGLIYWMMNNAWPSLHWNLFDYYLKGAGSYYGTKMGSRPEHVAFEYGSKDGDIWIINHTLDKKGVRSVDIELMSKDGKSIVTKTVKGTTVPNQSQHVGTIPEATKTEEPAFLRLILRDPMGVVLSRNVYWLSPTVDVLDWDESKWYYTPLTEYADYKTLFSMKPAKLSISATKSHSLQATVLLQNRAKVPAFFIRMELLDGNGDDILPAFWEDNYVTLWPGERLVVGVDWMVGRAASVRISGVNIGEAMNVAFK
jgi:exo-1,4-beta-D-glucosaminidase